VEAELEKVEDAIEKVGKKTKDAVEDSEEVPEEAKMLIGEKAKKLKKKAEDGLLKAKKLKKDLIDLKCKEVTGDKFEMRIHEMEGDADVVNRDAKKLWQVWQEARKLKDLEDNVAMYQTKLDEAEAREKQLLMGEKMMLQQIEHQNKAMCIGAGDQIKELEKAQKKYDKEDKVRAALIPEQIAKAKKREEAECQTIAILKTRYSALKGDNEKELKAIEEDKLELQKALDEETKLRDAAMEFLTEEVDKYTTTTTTTTLLTVVNATGNNGAAYCSAYCAYNWNEYAPSYWKGACCLKAYNANTWEEVSCMSLGGGAGTICTCQQADSTPFLEGAAEGNSYTNLDNLCADATGVAAVTPTTTTTTTTTTNLDCNCFHCGNSDPFNNADVCGAASSVCGPNSPDNGGCWNNRNSGCVCSTHTLIQPCTCYHCGGSEPFPSADVCGSASDVCGPTSPANGGCWNNQRSADGSGATCQCDIQQTTG